MHLKVDYCLWDDKKEKILFFKTLTITESQILDMLYREYDDDQFPVPMHLNKDEIIADIEISGISS
jgi:hypothetical protein